MRTLLVITSVFLASFAFGQSHGMEDIQPVQAGTAAMENGKAVINLNETATGALAEKSISPVYVVSITPLCNCGQFYVSEKGSGSFTVQQEGTANGVVSFDYVVYVKQSIQINNNSKSIISSRAPAVSK